MSRRKEPKLQIRFKSFKDLDQIEICANRQGEKAVPWSRKTLLRRAKKETAHAIISDAAMFSTFEAVSLLRHLAGPEASKRAAEEASSYIEKVEDDVAKDFD